MTLDEAIKHCEEEAEEKNNYAELFKKVKATDDKILKCLECANEHRQLAEWLKELEQLRKIYMNGYEEGYKDAKELYS